MAVDFQPDESCASRLDDADPLASFRDEFHLPVDASGSPLIYLCGHSLGLQPKSVKKCVEEELEDWATLGVEGHFAGRHPWYRYHEPFRESVARLVGAKPDEVVLMNSLTVNLHLMLVTFYRPRGRRTKILTDGPSFPSDRYALQSQIRWHDLDPAIELITIEPRGSCSFLSQDDIDSAFRRWGDEIALVLFNGVNFVTGQWYDLPKVVEQAKACGCAIGLDLAHAVGNVPLRLHDWNVDFAVWCSYKYLNGGPGAVAGCFVHEIHGSNIDLPRLAGWWGNDPATRFDMPEKFVPRQCADGWQLSNPPILSLAPLRASFELFDRAGTAALRAKSELLTSYLLFLLDRLPRAIEVVTPRPPEHHGCQISLRFPARAQQIVRKLRAHGVVCDERPPDIVRLAPVPLYNSFRDVYQFAERLRQIDLDLA
ncbi:MAG: kynureninase [Gemmatales bacterium]|nr:MAG: kynureninase [Gemmatales bacterium]